MIGNSLGWYTALAVAGALSFDDAFRLVQEIALLQEEPLPDGGAGGQVIYPLADADWRPAPDLRAAVAGVVDGPTMATAPAASTRASTWAPTPCWPATTPAWRRCSTGCRR